MSDFAPSLLYVPAPLAPRVCRLRMTAIAIARYATAATSTRLAWPENQRWLQPPLALVSQTGTAAHRNSNTTSAATAPTDQNRSHPTWRSILPRLADCIDCVLLAAGPTIAL